MASASELKTSELDTLIKTLSLQDYYPEKLSRQQLCEITDLSIQDTEHITQQNIAWHFVNRITRLNSNARCLKVTATVASEKPVGFLERRNQAKAKVVTDMHPLDIQVAVFLCCDPIAKQDLVSFLWDCKLAVPFILQHNKTNHPVLFKWPLRQLVAKWQGKGDITPTEYPIYNYPMANIGFVRMGQCESKSQLINGIIGGSEKALGSMFFHRDLPGSKKQRSSIVDGLVELAWYFPEGSPTDALKSCVMFANLRGDARDFKEQTQFLRKFLNILIVVTTSIHLDTGRETLKQYLAFGNKVILVLTNNEINDSTVERRINTFVSYLGKYDEETFEIIIFEEHRLAEKLDMLTVQINKMLKSRTVSINEYCHKKNCHEIIIDEEECNNIKVGIQNAGAIIDRVRQTPERERKNRYLPLQGNLWKEWTKTEIEMHRLKAFLHAGSGQDKASYQDQLENNKSKFRDEQMNLIEKPSSDIMSYFVSNLSMPSESKLQIFLRTLKLGLDELSRTALRPCYESYQRILDKKTQAVQDENDSLNKELEELDLYKSTVSFGLEHFTRELGQVFEACAMKKGNNYSLFSSKSSKLAIKCGDIPFLASRLLLQGYPIEIMDGDVGFVPELWIKHVLLVTRYFLKKKEGHEPILHIVPVLGIQSSGKSTLLNAMFGLQFAVSAGRCTKGVFIQMVKISETLRKNLKCDYLIAIDTEGLRSARLSSDDSIEFDNELSCFAIGMADTTIVNLMGENATYLEENLPIVVHAFLRMDMVGLQPQCTIVHHNVDKRNKDKLMEQTRLLEHVLNKLTKKACEMEKISPPKRFNEIIKFDGNNHIDYIPALFHGEQPMASISVGYSQECDELRKKLLTNIKQCSRRMNISQFSKHLGNLWNAIKKDQFVFEFKSTLETEAMLYWDEYYCKQHGLFLEQVAEIEENSFNSISKLALQEGRASAFGKSVKRIESELDAAIRKCRLKLVNFIQKPNKVTASALLPLKEAVLKQADYDLNEAKCDCLKQITSAFTKEAEEKTMQSISHIDIKNLHSLIDSKKRTLSSTDELIDSVWVKWKSCIATRQIDEQREFLDMPNIAGDAEKLLYSTFISNKRLIDKAIETKPLKMHSFVDFEVDLKHIPMNERATALELHPMKSMLETVVKTVKSNVDFALESIREKRTQYSASFFKRILFGVKQITSRNKNNSTNHFIIDLSLAVAGYAITEINNIHINPAKYIEIMDNLEKNKKFFVDIIKSRIISDEQQRLKAVSKIIYDTIVSDVLSQMLQAIPRKNKEIARIIAIPKGIMISKLLYWCVVNNREILEVYRADPESALECYFRNIINIENLACDAERSVMTTLGRLIYILEDSSQWVKGLKESTVLEWLKFVYECAQLHCDFKNRPEFGVFESIDVLLLSRFVLKMIKTSSVSISKQASKSVYDNCDRLKEITASVLADRCSGCSERCPFCNEVCMFSSKAHAGSHETRFHRPAGLTGIYNKTTNCVCLRTCESLVAGNDVITLNAITIPYEVYQIILRKRWRISGVKLYADNTVTIEKATVPFHQYKLVFPSWSINADPSSKASTLWKWYFVNTFKLEKRSCSVRYPSSWRTITTHDVLEHLSVDEP